MLMHVDEAIATMPAASITSSKSSLGGAIDLGPTVSIWRPATAMNPSGQTSRLLLTVTT
jgi:hypothetical protein